MRRIDKPMDIENLPFFGVTKVCVRVFFLKQFFFHMNCVDLSFCFVKQPQNHYNDTPIRWNKNI